MSDIYADMSAYLLNRANFYRSIGWKGLAEMLEGEAASVTLAPTEPEPVPDDWFEAEHFHGDHARGY